MNIAIQCESPLLQKSLELYLEHYLSPLEQCDFVLSDKRATQTLHQTPICLIGTRGAHIQLPFSKEDLLQACKMFYHHIQQESNRAKHPSKQASTPPSHSQHIANTHLSAQINELFEQTLQRFTQELKAILRNASTH